MECVNGVKKTIVDKLDEGKLIKQGLNMQEMSKDDVKKKIENEDKIIKHNTKTEFYKIKKFESDFLNNLLLNSNKTYLQDIKISNYVYDVIEISNIYTNDIIYEIKHWYDTPSIANLTKLNNTLNKMKKDYLNTRNKNVDIVLIINSLNNMPSNYKIIEENLSEIKRINVYGNDVNNVLADIPLR